MRTLPIVVALLGPTATPDEPAESVEPATGEAGPDESAAEPDAAEPNVEARADALVREGRLDEAFELLEEAYYAQERPQPRLLFGMAVIELERGRCESAVGYLGRFLATDPAPRAAERAREVIAYCEAELRERAEPPPPEPAAAESATAEPVAAEPSVVVEPSPEPDAESPRAEQDHAWYRDGLAWGLVGTGVVVGGVGAGLLVQARSDVRAAERAEDEAAFDRSLERVDVLRGIGGALTGVGAALLVGAAVRYGVVARRRRRMTASARFGPGRSLVHVTLRF